MARITCVQSKHNHYFDNCICWFDNYNNTERLADTHYEQCHLLLPILVRCIMYGTHDVLNNAIKV